MSKLAIVHHSAHGHTEFIARQVRAGTSEVDGIEARLLRAEDVARRPDELVGYDGLVFASPTYLGGVSGLGNPILPEQRSGVPDDEAANRLGS